MGLGLYKLGLGGTVRIEVLMVGGAVERMGCSELRKILRGFEPNSIANAASLQGAPHGHLAEV